MAEAFPEGLREEQKARPIIDTIDRVLARHHGFTDEELDFIPSTTFRTGINYDIKHRLGQDGAEGAEEE